MKAKLLPLLVAAILVSALLAERSASASSRSPRPAGPQSSSARGPVLLTSYSGNDGPNSSLVLTGGIADFGQAERTYANDTSKKGYNQLLLAATRGSFRLDISGIEDTLVSAFSHFPSNLTTCSGIVTAAGSAPIVAGSGTGGYKGISGNFKMTITINEVDSWPRCTSLLAETIYTSGSGTVSFS